MPSRITKIFQDCLTLVESIKTNEKIKGVDKNKWLRNLFNYFNVWDDQIDNEIKGTGYSFGSKAVFVEFIPGEAKGLGRGMISYPYAKIRLHIVNVVLDGGNNTMEQNIEIFELRDELQNKFNRGNISFCSTLMPDEDKLDYKHKNIYKYILSYCFNFIDDKGSDYVDKSGKSFGYLINPTLNLNVLTPWVSEKIYETGIVGTTIFYINENGDFYVDENGNFYVYNEGTLFEFSNIVSRLNKIYICINSNSDIEFNLNNWLEIKSWTPRKFILNEITFYWSHIYKCITPNEDETFDITKWQLISS